MLVYFIRLFFYVILTRKTKNFTWNFFYGLTHTGGILHIKITRGMMSGYSFKSSLSPHIHENHLKASIFVKNKTLWIDRTPI